MGGDTIYGVEIANMGGRIHYMWGGKTVNKAKERPFFNETPARSHDSQITHIIMDIVCARVQPNNSSYRNCNNTQDAPIYYYQLIKD